MYCEFFLLGTIDFLLFIGFNQDGQLLIASDRILCLVRILYGRMSFLVTLSLCISNGSMGCLSKVIIRPRSSVIARLLSCPSAQKLSIWPRYEANYINTVLLNVRNMTKDPIFNADEVHSTQNFIIQPSWINEIFETPYSSYLYLNWVEQSV